VTPGTIDAMAKRKQAVISINRASRLKRALKRNVKRSLLPPANEAMQALRDVTGVSEKTAKRLLESHPSGRGLAQTTEAGFRELGATALQARRLRAAFTLVDICDANCEVLARGTHLREPQDVSRFLRRILGRNEQESFVVILLSGRQKVIDVLQVGMGSLAQVDVHPREVFRDAVKLGAHSVIIAHNHPSGDPEPSEADIGLTSRLVEVGRVMGVPVLDHIVVTRRGTVSLAALGMV